MVKLSTAREIMRKAIIDAGSKPDVGLLDLYRGCTEEPGECTIVYYNRTKDELVRERTVISSKCEGDIDELRELMEEYNNRIQKATEELLSGEYSWVDAHTFNYWHRVGSDYGYCHITVVK